MKTVQEANKWIDRLFAISLALMGLTSAILSVTGLFGLTLPDWALRLTGIVNLASLPVLTYSTVESLREKLSMRKAAEAKKNRKKRKKK